jgi:hypothetical protein
MQNRHGVRCYQNLAGHAEVETLLAANLEVHFSCRQTHCCEHVADTLFRSLRQQAVVSIGADTDLVNKAVEQVRLLRRGQDLQVMLLHRYSISLRLTVLTRHHIVATLDIV